MNKYKVKGTRVAAAKSQAELAEAMGISLSSYVKKENGKVSFSDREKVIFAEECKLTMRELNDLLYDGILPLDR